jgi:hypothetical protein
LEAGYGISDSVAIVLEKFATAACVGAALRVIVLHAVKVDVPIWLEKLVAGAYVGAFISVMGSIALKVGRVQRVVLKVVVFLFSYLVVHPNYAVYKR